MVHAVHYVCTIYSTPTVIHVVGCVIDNLKVTYLIYASRRSRTRDTVKLTVCVYVSVCSSCNCSTVAMRRKLYRLLATFSWILIRRFAN